MLTCSILVHGPLLQSVQTTNRMNSRLPDKLYLKVTLSMTTHDKTTIKETLSQMTLQQKPTKQDHMTV